jgi:hypothetical protein
MDDAVAFEKTQIAKSSTKLPKLVPQGTEWDNELRAFLQWEKNRVKTEGSDGR